MRERILVAIVLSAASLAGCADEPAQESPATVTMAGETPSPPPEEPWTETPARPSPVAAPTTIVHAADGFLRPASAWDGPLPRFAQLAIDAPAWEPTVGVDPRGRVFYAAEASAWEADVAPGLHPTLGTLTLPFASEDSGTSWEARPPAPPGVTRTPSRRIPTSMSTPRRVASS